MAIKLRTNIRHPAQVEGGSGITVTKENGIITVSLDPLSGAALTSTTITAGAGLTGGGDLSDNRNFAVGAGTGITVNADDVQLAAIADNRILANVAGSSAAPIANSISTILDETIGATQGAVIYRGASTWDLLAPGTSGHFLKTQGAAANPAWAAVPGGGDVLAANNGSEFADKAATRANLLIPDLVGGGFPMYNGKIVESNAANAATFAIKNLAGNDPSASDPVWIGFFAAGGYVPRAVTAATSITISSGSTLGTLSSYRCELAIVAVDNSGTVELAVAHRNESPTISTQTSKGGLYLDEALTYSTTAEGGAGAADSAATLYSTTARASKQVRVVARAEYDSGLATAGLWAASPTRIVAEHPSWGRKTSLPASFKAHKGGSPAGNQGSLTHQNYTKLTFQNEIFDVGGFYDNSNSKWTPPAGLVELSAAVWLPSAVQTAPANVVLKIWKNGTSGLEVGAGVGWAPAGFASTGGSFIPRTIDMCNGSDYYELYVYTENSGGGNTGVADGNPSHTWFCGNVIRG